MSQLRHTSIVLVVACFSIASCRSERIENTLPPKDSNSTPVQVPFPHPDNFKLPSEHGVIAVQSKNQNCTSCHGTDLRGGTSKVSCYQCHSQYPHNEWLAPRDHGKLMATADDTIKDQCARCHGVGTENALTLTVKSQYQPKACLSCHNYPHSNEWSKETEAAGFHGNMARGEKVAECTRCHGGDLRGDGDARKSCYSCHPDYPHQKNFASSHGESIVGKPLDKLSCFACHDKEKATSPTVAQGRPAECKSCHEYPHSDGWMSKASGSFHGRQFVEQGKTSCVGCHGDDFRGKGDPKKSCQACHNYPHDDNWTTGDHGQTVLAKTLDKSDCAMCHGATLKGGSSGVSCFSCHQNYPHNDDFVSPDKHGAVVKETTLAKSDCAMCHGKDYQGGGAKVACAQCHTYPHAKKGEEQRHMWAKREAHGAAVLTASIGRTDCYKCHGKDYTGGSSEIGCQMCHNYPHGSYGQSSDWSMPEKHGKTVLNGGGLAASDCKDCHGADFAGGNTKVSCTQCHKSYPHPAKFVLPVASQNNPDQHSVYIKNHGDDPTMCGTTCHGEDMAGGDTKVDCKTCHQQYPAPHKADSWVVPDNDNDPKHHKAFIAQHGNDPKICASACHGKDMKGGLAHVSCYQCHWHN